MKGYKAFHWDMCCRPLLTPPMMYEIGETYRIPEMPVLCEKGFHFCREVIQVYDWYAPTFDTRVCEVVASGDVVEGPFPPKLATNCLTVVRELTPKEILGFLHTEGTFGSNSVRRNMLDSVASFYKLPERYVLWGFNSSTSRTPSEREIHRLRERADEWWELLKELFQELLEESKLEEAEK